jgi:hypothetical protein
MHATVETLEAGVIPITKRPVDLFFVCAFFAFLCTSILFDSLNALNIPISPTSDNALARLTYELYAKDTDLLLAANPFWTQLQLWISTFVFAPFYVAAIYALVRGRDWIHIPAIAYASAMVYSLVLYLGAQFAEPYRSPNPMKIFAANLPYALIAVAFAWRMRRARPFSE